jgi:peroxiredoxin
MVARRPTAHDAAMTLPAATYNYPAFNFAVADGTFERFLSAAPQLGAVAPNFELPDLEGRHHRLADWRGQPIVIEFGSYTCPIFCGHSPAMEQLAATHPEVAFVVVYTREAHPGERVPGHATVADKARLARRLVEDDKIGRLVLVDDLDGTVHRAYGSVWDAVFVLDSAGNVVLRRVWNDPGHLDVTLQALRAGERVRAESTDMSPPATRAGFGHGLLRGGRQAVLDFYQSAPTAVRAQLETSTSLAVREVLDTAAAGSR